MPKAKIENLKEFSTEYWNWDVDLENLIGRVVQNTIKKEILENPPEVVLEVNGDKLKFVLPLFGEYYDGGIHLTFTFSTLIEEIKQSDDRAEIKKIADLFLDFSEKVRKIRPRSLGMFRK